MNRECENGRFPKALITSVHLESYKYVGLGGFSKDTFNMRRTQSETKLLCFRRLCESNRSSMQMRKTSHLH